MRSLRAALLALVVSSALAGCSCDPAPAGPDAGAIDATIPDAAPEDASRPEPRAIEGELRFLGCTPAPEQVTVRLREVHLVARPEGDAGAEPPEGRIATASVSRTSDAHVLQFESEPLPIGALYQVGVEVDEAAACTRLAWRGPHAGLVTAGQEPASFDALALRTSLEVLGDRGGVPRWVSHDLLRPGDTTRRFRWSSELEGVSAVELQLASDRFDVDALSPERACAEPEGLLHVQHVPRPVTAPTEQVEVDVDLAALLAPPPAEASELERARWARMQRGAPIYVRAVPVLAESRACDPEVSGASSWVELAVVKELPTGVLAQGPAVSLTGEYQGVTWPSYHPLSNYTCMQVIRAHTLPTAQDLWGHLGDYDGMSWMLALSRVYPEGATLLPGEWFCYQPGSHDSSWLEDIAEGFSDLVGEIVDAVSWLVDRVAALYDEIKNAVIDIVAFAVSELTGCGEPCRDLIEIAVEAGLVAMGLPPSLPDFDQLAEQGIDYLASEIANQVGVPPIVVEQAFEIAEDVVARAEETRGLPASPWLIDDSRFRAPVVTLEVERGSLLETPERFFRVRGGEGLWLETVLSVHVPAVGEPALRVPVVLQPDFAGLPDVPPLYDLPAPWGAQYGVPQRTQVWFETRWAERSLVHPCVSLTVEGMDYSASPPFFVPTETYARATFANAESASFGAYEMQCTP